MSTAKRFEPLKIFRPLHAIRSLATQAEGWWFDKTRNVQTSAYIPLESLTVAGDGKSGFDYYPTRPAAARQALEKIPIQNYSEYTFIDLGSGMGRMLLLAAEYPFRKIQGVEFAAELHRKAQQNISRYRHSARRCADIESVHSGASEFRFPEGKLVLYLFNPFGPEVLTKVLANLEASLAQNPRHVVVVILNPEFASVADSTPYLHLYSQTRRFRVYQTGTDSDYGRGDMPRAQRVEAP
jgi:cyclopropane fatty-acyl-phospholipid synthase-like methyltransferase